MNEDTPRTVRKIAQAASDASNVLASLSRQQRADMLVAFADGLDRDSAVLVEIATAESHLEPELLQAEVERTTAQLRFFGEVLHDGAYLEITVDRDREQPSTHRILVPLGPVAVFGASNFPFAYGVIGGDSTSALAAGCAVVAKEHPSHPRTCRAILATLHGVLDELGLPRSIISVVRGFEAGRLLVQSPQLRAAGFTGSTRGGRALHDLCALRPDPIPFYGELGSLNSVVVTEAAALRRATRIAGILGESLLRRGGQMCTKPGLIFLPSDDGGDAILSQLVQDVRAATPVHLLNDGVRGQFVAETVALAKMAGVEVIAGAVSTSGDDAVTPVLFGAALQEFAGLNELDEIFGPTAVVLRYRSPEELAAALRQLSAALVVGIHAEVDEPATTDALLATLTTVAGRLVWGEATTGLPVGWATHHGGGYPASTSVLHTSVGAHAIRRWLRPVSFQSFPDDRLPVEFRAGSEFGPIRRINGVLAHHRNEYQIDIKTERE